MSELDQTLIEKHEDEVFALKKQLRTQEGEWKKNKAVLEQRIEILELQNRELKEKEENLKKMNNSIFGALKDFNKENSPHDSKMVHDLEATRQQVSKEYNEYKIKSQEVFKNLDKENKELKHKLAQLENKISQIALHYEKNEAVLQQKLHNFENERKHHGAIIKALEEEKKNHQEKLISQNELQSKLGEVRFLLEKQAAEHRKQIEIIKSEHMETINNLKLLAESERTTLEIQIRKLLDNKKLDGTLFEDIKKNHEKEIILMTRENDHILKKCDTLEQQNRKLNESLIILEENLVEQRAENEREVKENKKLKQRIADIEAQVKKFEQTEKNLKHMITERDYKTEEVATDLKKKIINEKRRHDQAQELAKKYKEEGEKRVNMLMQESNKKDEVIKKLKAQLKAKDEKLSKKAEEEMNKTTNPSFLNISLVNQSISGSSKFNANRSMIQEIKTTRDANASKSVSQTKLSRNLTQKNLGGKDPKRESTDICEYDEDPFANENILMGLSPREITRISTERNQYNNRSVSDFLTSSVNMANTDKPMTFRQNIKQKRGDKQQPMLKINLAEGTAQSKDFNKKNTESDHSFKNKNTDNSPNLPTGSFELKKKSTSFSEVYPLSHAEKISSAGSDLGKLTPIHENSRSFFNINEISEHLNLTSSMNNGVKNSLSLNPSVANLSRGFQEMLDTSHKSNISAIQPQASDYRNTNTRANRIYSDDKNKELEERLREAEEHAMSAALAKERIEAEHDRLVAELKQTKMGWALSEQSKEESELALKNEIKFLIGKLLQAKNTGVNLSSSQGDLSQFTKSTALNKSTIDPQSSFANTSGFLNFSHYNPGNHFGSFSLNQYDQNSMITTNPNAGDNKRGDFLDKKSSKKNEKVYSEESDTPLKDKCLNIAEFDSLNDSPRRVSEFNNNENSLLMNLLSKSTNTKKSLRHVKQQD